MFEKWCYWIYRNSDETIRFYIHSRWHSKKCLYDFNNNDDKFLSLAYGSQDGTAIIKKFDINVISIISLINVFILMLVYQKRQCHKMNLVKCWVFILLVANSVDVIVGYFKYDLWKVSSNKLLDHMIGYTQVVHEETQISRSQIDQVCINKGLLEEFHENDIVQNLYFSNYDAVRIVFHKNKLDFSVSE